MLKCTNVNIPEKGIVASIDIGTTNIRCHIYDHSARIKGESNETLQILYPSQGRVEIEPSKLWQSFVHVFQSAIKAAHVEPDQVSCITISTQRGTFLTWDRETGKPFHNFIVWSDNRSETLCKQWNKSLQLKLIRFGAKLLYTVTRNRRYLMASALWFSTPMVSLRLVWALQNIPTIRQRAVEGMAMFGTLDTWLLWKMTNGTVHATEPSNASITGIYDPFEMCWGQWAIDMFNIPPSILPIVKSTNCFFGRTDPEIFGASIPITAMVGDQQASAFGECCFEVGDVKCTMGTGSFLQINTGKYVHASLKGLYPVIGWQIGEEVTYFAEGKSHDNGTVINWAQSIGLFEDPAVTSEIAKSVPDSGGVCFVPAFAGIQAPINDSQAVAAFVGLTTSTTKSHMIRAILESLCFRVLQMFELMQNESDFALKSIKLDGGTSQNDFVAQLISDLTTRPVERPKHKEMSALGAAFLGGLAVGVWKDKDELSRLVPKDKVFLPTDNYKEQYKKTVEIWEKAVARCLRWYQIE